MDPRESRPERTEGPLFSRPFRVTFIVARTGRTTEVRVDPHDPVSTGRDPHDGLPGSLLQIALSAGVPIEHACGGVCACATCHVIVREGAPSCSPPGEPEEDQLDQAVGLTPRSRLACRAIPDGACDLIVEVPAWNRNLAGERD